jgi:hypothetical protein
MVRFYDISRVRTELYSGQNGVMATIRTEIFSEGALNPSSQLRVKLTPFW